MPPSTVRQRTPPLSSLYSSDKCELPVPSLRTALQVQDRPAEPLPYSQRHRQCHPRDRGTTMMMMMMNLPITCQHISGTGLLRQYCTCRHTEIEVADQTTYLTQSQYTGTPGQPVPALTLQRQAPGRVTAGVPVFKSLVCQEIGPYEDLLTAVKRPKLKWYGRVT